MVGMATFYAFVYMCHTMGESIWHISITKLRADLEREMAVLQSEHSKYRPACLKADFEMQQSNLVTDLATPKAMHAACWM